VRDDNFLMLFNAHHDEIPFTLPADGDCAWKVLIDTARGDAFEPDATLGAGNVYVLGGRSFTLLQQVAVTS